MASLGLGPPAELLAEAIAPPRPEAVGHAVRLLHRLGAVSDAGGGELTPLGEKLARLQVHPMLGKMMLLGDLNYNHRALNYNQVHPMLGKMMLLGDLNYNHRALNYNQVHPMLGKMMLLGVLWGCAQPVLTVCAALGCAEMMTD